MNQNENKMLKEIKNALILAVITLSIIAVYFSYQWFKSKSEFKVEKNATVLLERIQKVAKLTTVAVSYTHLLLPSIPIKFLIVPQMATCIFSVLKFFTSYVSIAMGILLA